MFAWSAVPQRVLPHDDETMPWHRRIAKTAEWLIQDDGSLRETVAAFKPTRIRESTAATAERALRLSACSPQVAGDGIENPTTMSFFP